MREDDVGELLRGRGLRVTPQRRAIVGAFANEASEHLSADEVHARAAALVPELGRGTVYAALAELTELGVLAARGSPEPVRYELYTGAHQHFRCRLCLRLFDVALPKPATRGLSAKGYVVEQVSVVAEGVCAECVEYDEALHAAATRARARPSRKLPAGLVASTVDTPLGQLALGATPDGVVRVVFPSHADAPVLQQARRSRGGARAARHHLSAAKAAVSDYFAGRPVGECAIDWEQLDGAEALRAVTAIPRGGRASYDALATSAGARERGLAYGANPVAILVPCHRVMRGREVPRDYVGGDERREALLAIEDA
jgi:O-6-methylguanine DNA methyltransferase